MDNAAHDLVMQLEALAPANADFLHAGRFPNPETGKYTLGLKNQAGEWLLAFADDVTLAQAGYIAQLYNGSHVLIALARLGLEACGVAGIGHDVTICRACGSALVDLTRRATPHGEVYEIVCFDCGNTLTQIAPGQPAIAAGQSTVAGCAPAMCAHDDLCRQCGAALDLLEELTGLCTDCAAG